MARGFAENPQNINRRGRPRKGQALTDILNYELDQKDGDILNRHRIAKKLIELGIAGNVNAINIIMDRVEGKPRQNIETHVTSEIKTNFIEIKSKIMDALDNNPEEKKLVIAQLEEALDHNSD